MKNKKNIMEHKFKNEFSNLVSEEDGLKGEDENRKLELNDPMIFKTTTEFLNKFGISDEDEENGLDLVGMNRCIYYSIREHKNEETGDYLGTFFGEFLILHPRRWDISSIFVEEVKKEDAECLYFYLEKHKTRNSENWF